MAPRRALCEWQQRHHGALMSPDSLQTFYALALGFAWAGLLASGYQALTRQPASFRLLERGPRPSTFAAIPFIAFAAPFIIMRDAIRGGKLLGGSFPLTLASTVIAGFWSLMSGTVVVMAIAALQS
jgi:hypothetical protein